MKRRLLTSAIVTAAGLLSVLPGASAATRPYAPVGTVVPNAAQPTLTAFGRSGLLVTGTRGAARGSANGTLLASVGNHADSGRPVWSRPVRLGLIDQSHPAQVALDRRGVGAVAWSIRDRHGFGGYSVVRLRSANGSWSTPYRIPGSFEPVEGVAVNGRGVVAVVADSSSDAYPAVVAIHRPGGRWSIRRLTDVPDAPTSIAVAPDGSVYLAGAFSQRGAYGSTGFLARISPQGRMTRTTLPDDRVESVQVLATPDGHIDLLVGQAHTGKDDWESTADGETYWATHYVVRSRPGATGRWTTLWDHDGVVDPQATLVGNDVRLTWTQYADPISNNTDDHTFGNAPQRLELRTTEIGAATDDPNGTLLVGEPTGLPVTWGGPTIMSSTAASGRCLVVAWRTGTPSQRSPLSSTFDGTVRTWPDTGQVTTYDPEAAAACVAGHGYLARTGDQRVRGGYSGGFAVSGKLRVESLG